MVTGNRSCGSTRYFAKPYAEEIRLQKEALEIPFEGGFRGNQAFKRQVRKSISLNNVLSCLSSGQRFEHRSRL
jgi:hypothetical protein